MADNPWEMIARSQRAAAGLFVDTVSTLIDMGRTGVQRPEDALKQVTALAAAVGDLAGSTAKPLEAFVASQRQLAETMQTLATLQLQLAEVSQAAAANYVAVVDALELMTSPVIGVAHLLRHEEAVDKATKADRAAKSARRTAPESG